MKEIKVGRGKRGREMKERKRQEWAGRRREGEQENIRLKDN